MREATMDVTERLQQCILTKLDLENTIHDTSVLSATEAVDQQTVLGVLKRLEAHQVSYREGCMRVTVGTIDGRVCDS